MSVLTNDVAYLADGLEMTGTFYRNDAGDRPQPGVLVFPDITGLNAHAHERARRLAELGYAALACDLHGGGAVLSDIQEIMGALGRLMESPASIRMRARAALDALLAQPEVAATRVGAIGFCFGGTMALELARDGAPLAAVIGFHSGLATTTPEDAADITGKVLVCLGADDPMIPPAQRLAFEQEMEAGGVDWRMSVYDGVVHNFTNPDADKLNMPAVHRYDAAADARSWSEMRAVLEATQAGDPSRNGALT